LIEIDVDQRRGHPHVQVHGQRDQRRAGIVARTVSTPRWSPSASAFASNSTVMESWPPGGVTPLPVSG